MTTQEATQLLKEYNVWRRGAELEQPNPTVIGKAIDKLIAHVESHNTPEPLPSKGKQNVTEEVIKDLQERSAAGKEKYGTPLQTFNGRKPLIDLYQELLDAVQYLKQHLLEQH
jgi:hypothetical protein